ncbi:MAG: CoA pyrophosphatase [Zoogloeaceae bacterium]|nr:CoA pyrophosphatase [Zoogloeaceae bacterium]
MTFPENFSAAREENLFARVRSFLAPAPIGATEEDDFSGKTRGGLEEKALTPSAVLIALAPGEQGTRVLLTRRSDHLRDHPGQISFPGGRLEAIDASPAEAALREAKEEIGLKPEWVSVLGYLPTYRTATGFLIYPVVARLSADFSIQALTSDAAEVAEILAAPLEALLHPANRRRDTLVYQGRRHEYHVIECDIGAQPRVIWGATAGMLLMLARRLENAG